MGLFNVLHFAFIKKDDCDQKPACEYCFLTQPQMTYVGVVSHRGQAFQKYSQPVVFELSDSVIEVSLGRQKKKNDIKR